jgi:hypothetical protein
MFDFQWYMLGTTIGTGPVPFLQQIFTTFKTSQRPLLIPDTVDRGILHQLSIELDQFLAEGPQWAETPQTTDPGQNIAHATRQGRWEPSLRTATIEESWCPIPRLALATTPPDHASGIEGGFDLLAPMCQLCRPEDLVTLEECEAGGLGARIDLQPTRLCEKWARANRLQDDREWILSPDRGLPRR